MKVSSSPYVWSQFVGKGNSSISDQTIRSVRSLPINRQIALMAKHGVTVSQYANATGVKSTDVGRALAHYGVIYDLPTF